MRTAAGVFILLLVLASFFVNTTEGMYLLAMNIQRYTKISYEYPRNVLGIHFECIHMTLCVTLCLIYA